MLNHRLLKESSYKKLYFPLVILKPLLSSIFIVLSAYILATIVNIAFLEKQSLYKVSIYLALLLINAVIKAIVDFIIEVYIDNCAQDIKENIKQKSFKKIISGNAYKIKKEKLGEIINTLTNGVEMVKPYYLEYIPQLVAAVIMPCTIAIVTAFTDKWSALIMIITYPLIPLFMILIGYKTKKLNEKQWKKLNILSSHFIDMLQGLSTLKIFGKSNIQEYKVFKTSENYRKATMEVLKVAFCSALVLELFSALSIAMIAVSLGLQLVYSKINFFSAFFILIIAPDFYLAIRNLGLKFHASLNADVAIEKIDYITKKVQYQSKQFEQAKVSRYIFEIEVKNLNFSYKDKKALSDISFKISYGESVAIVGESGSGKSTLINILTGYIKVDDGMVFINGEDINHISYDDYLSKIASVPQFPYIFNETLETNVTLGIKKIGAQKLLEIYKLTKLDDLACKLERGYKTIIGDGESVAISGGEIQKIALARALAKNSQLIILDEPSSALDSKSEELFTKILDSYLRDTTVLIATHRLNTIKKVDKILVLDQGSLVEMGTHEKLINNKYKYYDFVKALEVLVP